MFMQENLLYILEFEHAKIAFRNKTKWLRFRYFMFSEISWSYICHIMHRYIQVDKKIIRFKDRANIASMEKRM